MRITLKPVAILLLPVLLATSPAFAQQARVVDAAALHQALVAQSTVEATQRAQVQQVLDRADVQQLAARMGLNLADARTAIGTLSGQQLADVAERASAADVALAGGANTIVISATTLLLIIIIIILLAQ